MTGVQPPASEADRAPECDKNAALCRAADNDIASLPAYARASINRCNLPALILGSLTFQHYPTALRLDGVAELHADLFRRLRPLGTGAARAQCFADYLAVHFCLQDLEAAGLSLASQRAGNARSNARTNANWMRVLRGWSFDADGREGAVLKAWVESRFGLLPRFHGEALRDFSGPAYMRYQEMRSAGLYGTNALEAQLDLVYAYCQYEFSLAGQDDKRIVLYRGINRLAEHEVLTGSARRQVVLFNNLVSFTASRERACEFGDLILTARVPAAKVFFHCGLVPDVVKSEDEYLVIGGVYDVALSTF